MSLKTESIDLETSEGPKTFEVTQLTVLRATKMLTRLGRLLGPSLKDMKGGTDAEALKMLGAAAIGDLLARLEETEVERLLLDLLETTTVDGAPVKKQLDLLFAGSLVEMFKLAAFALQVNFGDFFAALADLTRAKPASASKL